MILITGAGGTVGTAVIEELGKTDAKLRLGYHSADKAAKAKAAGHEAVALDFAKPETLAPALQDVETVFLLGSGGVGQADREINLVRAAKSAGVKRIVKLSVVGAAREEYVLAAMHRTVEKEIEASGLAWTFLRPNGFMQNFVNLMGGTIPSQNAFYQPAADGKVSHVDVRDIARVAAKVLTAPGHDGKAYELTGPEALSYADAAEILSSVLGRKITYVPISDDAAKAAMMGAGMPEWYADGLVGLNQHYRKGGAAAVTHDVETVTGRAPGTFRQFVADNKAAL